MSKNYPRSAAAVKPSSTAVQAPYLPVRHRQELDQLSADASMLDKTIAEHISGTVVLDRVNIINVGFGKVAIRAWSMSYRSQDALLASDQGASIEGAEWVTVSASTTLKHLLKEYGDRLLGYDAKKDEFSIEILSWDLIDTSAKTVRILVRKQF